jgi:hypothetical protein
MASAAGGSVGRVVNLWALGSMEAWKPGSLEAS